MERFFESMIPEKLRVCLLWPIVDCLQSHRSEVKDRLKKKMPSHLQSIFYACEIFHHHHLASPIQNNLCPPSLSEARTYRHLFRNCNTEHNSHDSGKRPLKNNNPFRCPEKPSMIIYGYFSPLQWPFTQNFPLTNFWLNIPFFHFLLRNNVV